MDEPSNHKSFRLTADPHSAEVAQHLGNTICTPLFLRWSVACSILIVTHFLVANVSHYVFGAWLYLAHIYGFQTVNDLSLSLMEMPRGLDWTVSNGDIVPNGGHIHFLYSTLLWCPVMVTASVIMVRTLGLSVPSNDDVEDKA